LTIWQHLAQKSRLFRNRLHDPDFFLREVVEVVHEAVDLAVGGGDPALEVGLLVVGACGRLQVADSSVLEKFMEVHFQIITDVFKSHLFDFPDKRMERDRRDVGHGTATSRSQTPTNRVSRGAGSASSRQTAIASRILSTASSIVWP
jgi:hypothetical protein